MNLPSPGQWVRVWHACPDATHDNPVEVLAVQRLLNDQWRIVTRRCDGLAMNLYPGEDCWEIAPHREAS